MTPVIAAPRMSRNVVAFTAPTRENPLRKGCATGFLLAGRADDRIWTPNGASSPDQHAKTIGVALPVLSGLSGTNPSSIRFQRISLPSWSGPYA